MKSFAPKSTLRMIRRRKGQGMTEYIIIVGLIAILLIAAVSSFKNALQNTFNASTNTIDAKITKQIG